MDDVSMQDSKNADTADSKNDGLPFDVRARSLN